MYIYDLGIFYSQMINEGNSYLVITMGLNNSIFGKK